MYGVKNPQPLNVADMTVLWMSRTLMPQTQRLPDTVDMARILGVSEAEVYNALSRARDAWHDRRQTEEREWKE
jgi:hypothetical protein